MATDRQERAQRIGVTLLLCGGALMFVASVVALVANTSSWWWAVFAVIGIIYLVMGMRARRRFRSN